MTLANAVALRIQSVLDSKKITLYRLERNSGILHGTLMTLMSGKTKNVTLKTIMQIARGFDMTLIEFLDDDLFRREDLEID